MTAMAFCCASFCADSWASWSACCATTCAMPSPPPIAPRTMSMVDGASVVTWTGSGISLRAVEM